jgi:hypothetical protein
VTCERDTCQKEFSPIQKHQRFCSSKCQKAAGKNKHRRTEEWKVTHATQIKKRKRKKRVRAKDRNKAIILKVKELGCTRCGEKDPVCLDFHHRDRKTKTSDMNRLRKNAGEARLRAEIAKCDVLCANCHRKVEHVLRMSNLSPSPSVTPG